MTVQAIERLLQEEFGFQEMLVGFSDLAGCVGSEFSGLTYGITIGLRLDSEIVDEIADGPTLRYFQHYTQVNHVLNQMAGRVARWLREGGNAACPLSATIGGESDLQYQRTLSVGFSHKMGATRAGLGWIGKSALLVSVKYGPRVRLVTILTDHRLPAGTPVTESRCGDCDLCVTRCPAKAISGREWTAGLPREAFFDAFACRETCRRLSQERMGILATVCGICVSVCPWGKIRR